MLVFGFDEIVHVYPIAGFLLLFFRGTAGTSLDGLVFRANVRFWRWLKHASSRVIYGSAVTAIAGSSACVLMFVPLFATVEFVPVLTGEAVGRHYKHPPPVPPAKLWPPPDGSAVASPSTKPHSDHRPHHNGVVMMNGDNHVELIVRKDGVIEVFVTDAVRTPIQPHDVRGVMKLEHPGMSRMLQLTPDAAGALTASGPPPTVATMYTYNLVIRGTAASTSLSVPPGGTDALPH
jgi:hypothetical protein